MLISAIGLCTASAAAQSIDAAALQRLDAAARSAHSDALVVLQHGQVVLSRNYADDATPIPAMSVTKSIANLAIGQLLTTGRVQSLDTPLATFFPAWQGGPKAAITLRHVMEHTSGLRHNPAWERSPDRLQLALDAPLDDAPGTRYVYNNTAVYVQKFYEVLPAQLSASRQTLYRVEAGPLIGLAALGYLGQQLVIYPESGLVAAEEALARTVSSGVRAYLNGSNVLFVVDANQMSAS